MMIICFPQKLKESASEFFLVLCEKLCALCGKNTRRTHFRSARLITPPIQTLPSKKEHIFFACRPAPGKTKLQSIYPASNRNKRRSSALLFLYPVPARG